MYHFIIHKKRIRCQNIIKMTERCNKVCSVSAIEILEYWKYWKFGILEIWNIGVHYKF